ncbi:MAG: S-methyl-5-thioribose-1-phosphate isomerase [bacterium]
MLHKESSKTTLPAFWKGDVYHVLDQLLLPESVKYIPCKTPEDVMNAIVNMNLRGAPLIGAAGSAAAALYFKESKKSTSFDNLLKKLIETRPTAVNLKNVLDEVKKLYKSSLNLQQTELFDIFKKFSKIIHERDNDRNIKMGENGALFLKTFFKGKKLNVLTHCNAGALATCGYGTALGVIRSLHKVGLIEHVWVDETRPYLQGARLTAYEMDLENIPHTVITDSTSAWLMHEGKVDVVITGADRVAMNGDFANKIGTYSLAVNAFYHKLPLVVALPLETFDRNMADGSSIVIEERSDRELLVFNGKRIAPKNSSGLHLGFDIVPASLLTAIVTEKRVLEKPLTEKAIAGLFND